jgi:hypothetical protein
LAPSEERSQTNLRPAGMFLVGKVSGPSRRDWKAVLVCSHDIALRME